MEKFYLFLKSVFAAGVLFLVVALVLRVFAPSEQWVSLKVLALLGLIGVYPLTYVAYLGYSAKTQRERLQDDFRLLGLAREAELVETVEKLYRTVYNPISFIIYISLILIVSLLVLWGYLNRAKLNFIGADTMELMFYGYLGAYVFSIQELVRRYNTFDLQPQVYTSILVRMSMAIVLTFVGSSLIVLSGSQIAAEPPAAGANEALDAQVWMAVIAFVIGVFPTQGMRWFMEQTNRILNVPEAPTNELPLRNILGISSWHEARLAQMGIDDAQNLATIDIRKLLLTTQFDAQQIINWIDQAILYVRVGPKIERFRDEKIIGFHQFRMLLSQLSLDDADKLTGSERNDLNETRKLLALALGMTDPGELDRVGNDADLPNYAHIAQYYGRTPTVAHQRASLGMDIVIGAIYDTDYRRAIEDGERLLFQNPNDANLLYTLGVAYYHLGYIDKALEAYNRAIDLKATMVEAYYMRSLVYIRKNDHKRAVRDCTTAIDIDATHAKAFNNRGLAYMKLGYLDRAIEDLNQALRLDERLAVAYLNRGVTFNAQGHFDSALLDFQRAYLLENRKDIWLSWGTALIGTNKFREAIEKLSYAVLYEANLADTYAKRGYAYLQLGEDYYQQAHIDLTAALEIAPDFPSAHSNLGLLEARMNRYDDAVQHYQEVLKIDAGQFVTRYNLGVAYHQLERFEDAKREFQQVIATAPKHSSEAKQAHSHLLSARYTVD